MKKLWLMLALPFLMLSCNAQNEGKEQEQQDQQEAMIQPKVDVKVNKQYDENGNLIAYDSVYVWSYTNSSGQAVDLDIDSVFSQFKPLIGQQFPQFFDPYGNRFFGDSLFYHDFFMPDYFMKRWKQQMLEMDRMMREMDSVKQLFFREHYPGLSTDKQKGKTL